MKYKYTRRQGQTNEIQMHIFQVRTLPHGWILDRVLEVRTLRSVSCCPPALNVTVGICLFVFCFVLFLLFFCFFCFVLFGLFSVTALSSNVCFCFCVVLFGLLSVTLLVVIVEICHCTWCYRRNLLGFLYCFDCFLLLHLMLWSDFVCFCFFGLLFTCTNFEVLLQKFQLWLRTQIGKL